MTARTPDGAETFDFWYSAAGKWRVEHEGEVLFLTDGTATFLRGEDGDLTRHDGGRSSFRAVGLGSGFSPLDLVGGQGLLYRMSRDIAVVGGPEPRNVEDRECWSTELATGESPDRRVTITIDGRTGLVVGVDTPAGGSVEVTGLREDSFDDALFLPDDAPDAVEVPVVTDRQRMVERLQRLAALDAGLTRRDEVMRLVADAADAETAVAAVAELLDVDVVAAGVVLAAQVRSFTVEARDKLARELADLREIIASLDPDEA